jgi:hypothetical protein
MMRQTILQILNRQMLAITLTCGLTACQPPQPQPLSVRYVAPLDMQALGLGNLISFDVYADQHRLHALFAATRPDGQSPYFGYLTSEDGGEHWQMPVALTALLTHGLESKIGNDVQIAAHGTQLLAIWQSTGEIPGMGPLSGAASSDGGMHWQAVTPPAMPETDQSHADLAADEQGRFHLIWLDDREENGYQGLRYAQTDDYGLHWQQQQTLDDSTCSCCWNRLRVDAQNRLQILFRDGEPRDMAVLTSQDRGEHWQRSAPLSAFNWQFDGCPHNGGGLAGFDEALFATIWTGAESQAGLYFVYSPDYGKNWSAPMALAKPDDAAFHSDIAVLDAAHVVAVWDAHGAQGMQVLFAESYDHGQHWQAARRLSQDAASASFPRLLNSAQGLLALWVEQMPGGAKRWQSAVLR